MKRILAVAALAACLSMLFVSTVLAVDPTDFSGVVLDLQDSEGYTYVQIDADGERVWVMIPQTNLGRGKVVSFTNCAKINNTRVGTAYLCSGGVGR